MQWAIVQLTAWAEKTLLTKDLALEIRRRCATPDLELYYPAVEDEAGKHPGAYTEYVFVEYRPEVEYEGLENNDVFRGVLRGATGRVELLDELAVAKIRSQCEVEGKMSPGERVVVWKGPMRGNVGEVLSCDGAYVLLRVALGDEVTEASVPANWVRRRRRRRREE